MTYTNIDEGDVEEVTNIAKDMLPDEAELVLLSFTGGRAFGWGGEHHDIDVHGFFAHKKDWFFKCHSTVGGFDMTLQNVHSVEDPELRWGRWKQYYDKSNPIYTHEDFDIQEDFLDECKPRYVNNVFPYDLHLQFSRMDVEFHTRSALHTYKEMLIPLYYLQQGEIESNVVDVINEHEDYQYEELSKCAEKYKHRENNGIEIDRDKVWEELEEIYWRLADMVEQTEGSIDSSEIHGPPMPSEDIPGGNE